MTAPTGEDLLRTIARFFIRCVALALTIVVVVWLVSVLGGWAGVIAIDLPWRPAL